MYIAMKYAFSTYVTKIIFKIKRRLSALIPVNCEPDYSKKILEAFEYKIA